MTEPVSKVPHYRGLMDDESKLILAEGASVKQLARLFHMEDQTVQNRIIGKVHPRGERRNYAIYDIAEAAPYLCAPQATQIDSGDVDKLISEIRRTGKLPPNLSKDFWSAMRARQAYERDARELLHSTEVTDALATIFKGFRMSILLIREAVEREDDLTQSQRDIITRYMDAALDAAYNNVINAFPEKQEATTDDEL